MQISSTSPIPPEQKLPPYQAVRLTDDLQRPGGVARYYKKLAAQRQNIENTVKEALSRQECKNGAKQLATVLRKFHNI